MQLKKALVTSSAVSIMSFAISLALAADAAAADFSNVRGTTNQVALGSSRSGGLNATALARAQTKFARALQIANRFNAQYQQHPNGVVDPSRVELINNLMQGDAQGLTAAAYAGSLDNALAIASASAIRKGNTTTVSSHSNAVSTNTVSASDQIGDASDDLVYTPIIPCRVVDTRIATFQAGAPLAGGTYTSFSLTNDDATQGGGSCPVYTGSVPTAVTMNIVADQTLLGNATDSGFLSVLPTQPVGLPTTSWMNYTGREIIANEGIATINPADGSFVVFVQNDSQIAIDVYGYFRAPTVIPTGPSLSGLLTTVVSTLPLGVPSHNSSGPGTKSDTLVCPADHPVALSGSYSANAAFVYAAVSSVATTTTANDSWTFTWENTDNNAHQVTYSVLCSQ